MTVYLSLSITSSTCKEHEMKAAASRRLMGVCDFANAIPPQPNPHFRILPIHEPQFKPVPPANKLFFFESQLKFQFRKNHNPETGVRSDSQSIGQSVSLGIGTHL